MRLFRASPAAAPRTPDKFIGSYQRAGEGAIGCRGTAVPGSGAVDSDATGTVGERDDARLSQLIGELEQTAQNLGGAARTIEKLADWLDTR
ncbi:hypothetical protein GCM10023084_25740 [Streptomyces lacrimifluminis]|uniref:Uncharacterized protein n=1 Tax=Streptomyces lacrimifluminis TaxID=1500077 RepID=A0A917NNB8_9ACTN|nr:hypothetical protein [Streptomyces lacrimifluminis]GGJ13682.1 hypothetical protein GCM10012282_07510 [Streptomyces lacrimifluminis]